MRKHLTLALELLTWMRAKIPCSSDLIPDASYFLAMRKGKPSVRSDRGLEFVDQDSCSSDSGVEHLLD